MASRAGRGCSQAQRSRSGTLTSATTATSGVAGRARTGVALAGLAPRVLAARRRIAAVDERAARGCPRKPGSSITKQGERIKIVVIAQRTNAALLAEHRLHPAQHRDVVTIGGAVSSRKRREGAGLRVVGGSPFLISIDFSVTLHFIYLYVHQHSRCRVGGSFGRAGAQRPRAPFAL